MAKLTTLLWTLSALSVYACAPHRAVGQRQFGPHQLVVRHQELSIRAVRAVYGATQLAVELELVNASDATVELDPQACLLAYQELEFPPVFENTTGPALLSLAPGSQQRVELRYEVGGPVAGSATLVFRGIRRHDRWQTPISLILPAKPPADTQNTGARRP